MQFWRISLLCLLFILGSCRYGKIMSKADPETETTVDTLAGPRELTTKGAEPGEFEVRVEEELIDLSRFEMTKANISYTNSENPQQTLDIIYPSEGQKPFKPVLIFYKGGPTGDMSGSEAETLILEAAEQGYAIVPVNYRHSGEWPAALHDAKAAVRFLRANSEELELDTEEIVVWGASAGSRIAQMLAATNNQNEFEDASMGNPNASSAVQGVVSWNGISNLDELPEAVTDWVNKTAGSDVKQDQEKTRHLNPVDLVTADFPPTLLVHEITDQLIPFQQSEEMHQRVNEATGKRTARLLPYQNTGDENSLSGTNEKLRATLDFFDKILFAGDNPHRGADKEDVVKE